ncbi:type III PLP-dependent enzyme [Chitinimonas sp. BJYL2]|uniref:type III PLP-dependent enzyme n=1 Tax=Chitinimonas sp. BJYL2 TaxID=2976696 RepID=UPI0022B2F410|nr:type III PLP-dependent enzyme [Chitinimonas sp. BJYL2]
MHPQEHPDLPLLRNALAQGHPTPLLLMKATTLTAQVQRFRAALPRVIPHFAVKCNPDPAVLRTLRAAGAGFEIASPDELQRCLALGVPAAELYYSNPVRARDAIAQAARAGVQWFVIDSIEELHKVHAIHPGASLYLRLHTSNEGAVSPLSDKFGVLEADIAPLLDEAMRLRADLAGVTFHAGSQCLNPDNWLIGIRAALAVFGQMRERGLRPRLLNLGGGYPVRHREPVPDIETIAAQVNTLLASVPDEVHIIAEPGRFLVSEAGWLLTRVIGTTVRRGQPWAYLDAGVFQGLLESITGIEYDLYTERHGPRVPWVIAGPTCDSMDICHRAQPMPADLREGDLVYVRNAGAYSNACSSGFNGFALPEVVLV